MERKLRSSQERKFWRRSATRSPRMRFIPSRNPLRQVLKEPTGIPKGQAPASVKEGNSQGKGRDFQEALAGFHQAGGEASGKGAFLQGEGASGIRGRKEWAFQLRKGLQLQALMKRQSSSPCCNA